MSVSGLDATGIAVDVDMAPIGERAPASCAMTLGTSLCLQLEMEEEPMIVVPYGYVSNLYTIAVGSYSQNGTVPAQLCMSW